MDYLKTLYYELMSAVRSCREDGYSLGSVNRAMDRAARYYEALPPGNQKTAVAELLAGLKKKQTIAKQVSSQKRAEIVSRKDLDDLCPITPVVRLPAPTLSVSGAIEANFSRMYRDNALILYGPFMDELVFESRNFAKSRSMDFRCVDIRHCIEYGSLSKALDLLLGYYSKARVKDVIAYKGIEGLNGHYNEAKAFSLMLRELRLKAKGCVQLLLCSNPSYDFNGRYTACFDAEGADEDGSSADGMPAGMDTDFSIGEMCTSYLPLPSCGEVTKAVLSALHFAPSSGQGPDGSGAGTYGTGGGGDIYAQRTARDREELENYIKRYCAPLACGALADILRQSGTAAAFESNASRCVGMLESTLNNFFAKGGLSAFNAIMAEDWDYKRPEMKKIGRSGAPRTPAEYEYTLPQTEFDADPELADAVAGIRENVQYVLDAKADRDGRPLSVKEKCGLAVRYAITDGEPVTHEALERVMTGEEIMKARWTIAYAALTQLMRTVSGTIVLDIEDDSPFAGLCCENGKLIRMRKQYLSDQSPRDIEWACKAILHELLHAIQRRSVAALQKVERCEGKNCAEELELLDYYRDNFGISQYRISGAWNDNYTRKYFDYNKERDHYYVQVVEADARTFADEAWDASGKVFLAPVH